MLALPEGPPGEGDRGECVTGGEAGMGLDVGRAAWAGGAGLGCEAPRMTNGLFQTVGLGALF